MAISKSLVNTDSFAEFNVAEMCAPLFQREQFGYACFFGERGKIKRPLFALAVWVRP